MLFKNYNVATRLTMYRLIIAPIIVPFLIVYVLPYNNVWLNASIAFVFLLIGLTDFLDGYLARKYNQVTEFGKQLDPIADKFLTYSTFIALLAINKIYFFWVIVFIGREIFIMGLRQIALQQNITLSVSWTAKLKTIMQFALLTVIISNPSQQSGFANNWNVIEVVLLFGALLLSLLSAYDYIRLYLSKLPVSNELIQDLSQEQ